MSSKLVACLLVLFTSSVLHAQDAPPAVTAGDPSIPIETLEQRLTPLTVAELESEAMAWRDLLKAKAGEVAEAQIAGETPQAELDRMKNDEKALMDRLGSVLDSWEAKGGEPDELRAYLTALRGADLRVTNPSGLAASFRRWVEAEDGMMRWLVKLGIFAVIIIVFSILASVFGNIASKAMDRHKGSSQLLDRFVCKVVRRGIFLIGVIIALATLGVKVGGLLALIGGGAFIIGFALQDTLGNFASGVMLMIYQPFDVGDAVEIGGVSGTVDSVSLVSTTIRSWDNKLILVPNKKVWGETITNITGTETRRVDMVFGIGYDDDAEKAQSILETIVNEHELVLKEPEPTIRMHELADSSVNFVCRPWTMPSDYWAVYWDVTKRVKAEFDAQGISIPYPQRDIHVHQAG
ncbi:MAG: mechanosensitive ion channel [Akkermansiaceae bacterium]|nr:mechanosensitive ion channel [Akkermansiaceae bacterium]MCP5548185.1 mechanosensitive ion channel [Akkermansiaceae bacterium]